MGLEMVDLAQLECKDYYAFDKDKVYCVKLSVPKDYPRESISIVCKSVVDAFSSCGVNVVVIPQIEGGINFEFFNINSVDDVKNI